MAQSIKENGPSTKSADQAFIDGQMDVFMTANGAIITCMEEVLTPGQMVDAILENIKTTKSMGKEPMSGPMEEATLEAGKMASNTETVNISKLMVTLGKDTGKMESAHNG